MIQLEAMCKFQRLLFHQPCCFHQKHDCKRFNDLTEWMHVFSVTFSNGKHHSASIIQTQSHHGHITDLYMLAMINLRNIAPRIFLALFRLNRKIIVVKLTLQSPDCYKILHMPWQPCCCGMCKNLQQSNCKELNYIKVSLTSSWNNGWNNINEMVPRWHCSPWASLWLT